MSKISIDIDLYRKRTSVLTPSLKIDFIELLFMMREGIRVNDQMVMNAYGDMKAARLWQCFDTDQENWTYPDVEKALKLDRSRKANAVLATASRTDSVTTRKPTKKPTRKTRPNLIYTKCTEIYHTWFEEIHGVKPQFDGSDGKAMKTIIKWLETNATEGSSPEDGLRYIFANWNRLDDFTQKRSRVRDISSNLNSIITQLKNGQVKKSTEQFLDQEGWANHFANRDQATN